MTDSVRISHQELLPLPRWARLALALRCVRRARHLLRVPVAELATVDGALAQLDGAIRRAQAGDELADAAAAAYTLALDNLDGQTTVEAEEDTVVVTCMVAHATAFAAEAATLPDGRAAAHLVGQAVDFAVHAHRLAHAAGTSTALTAMRTDLERLRQEAERQRWTDQTPIPPEFLAP
jgi:hypothetical protein